jgi:hypothetical protein
MGRFYSGFSARGEGDKSHLKSLKGGIFPLKVA